MKDQITETTMDITQKWLAKHDACQEAREWVSEQNTRDEIKLIKLAMKIPRFDWVNWYMVRRFNKRKNVQYAIFAAEKVLGIYEKQYPDGNRPRKAIEAAKRYLKWPSKKTKDAAADAATNAAANAAYAAAYSAAHAAVYAAADAADTADAVYAAADAADAADAAAYAAAYAAYAAGLKLQKQIVKYGLELLGEK